MINVTVNSSGVIKSWESLTKALTGVDTMGRILHYVSSALWVPSINNRLFRSTATSDYRDKLGFTFDDIDPEFVAYMGRGGAWSSKTDAERRVPGGYKQGEITANISSAIKASMPIEQSGVLMVGVASIDELNAVAGIIGTNSHYPIWQILQWGTGSFAPGGSPVIRTGRQIFFDGDDRGVFVGAGFPKAFSEATVNPGFKGREYFVQLSGEMHRNDYVTVAYVMKYISRMVKKYSYKR